MASTMRPSWLDHIRSRITGIPAKAYSTRRIAIEDLERLRNHQARQLTEDIELMNQMVNPLDRWMDGGRLLTPIGTIQDRRSGKNLPLVWTELDLRYFRRESRVLCDVNSFAVGFLGLLVDFHIGLGYGWQACLKGAKKGAQDTGQDSDDIDPAVRECQIVLDEWRDLAQWPLKSREGFRRWRRDGEVFIRFFRGGSDTRGLPVIRFVEPEQVGLPPGDDADGRWSFGILTDPDDVITVHAFFVRDPLGTGSDGAEVPASRILHLKANVDDAIKRGIPDFVPVQDDLDRCRKLIRNMGISTVVGAAIAYIKQYAVATAQQVGTLIAQGADYIRPSVASPNGALVNVSNLEPGTVLSIDANMQFLPPPAMANGPATIAVHQAMLRSSGARWRMPEYFSGDASNNNLLSSITAGSPFVKAVEGGQLDWGVFELAAAKKVLELSVESGRLSRDQVDRVDVEVTPPQVALANEKEKNDILEAENRAGVTSITTWQKQVGRDPKHEAANFAAEAKRKAALGPPAGQGSGNPNQDPNAPPAGGNPPPTNDPTQEGGGDSVLDIFLLSEGRTEGEVWQGSGNRWFTLKNGRTVPAKAPGSTDPGAGNTPPTDAPPKTPRAKRADVTTSLGDVLPAVVSLHNAADAGFNAMRTAVQKPEDKALLMDWASKVKDVGGALTKRIAGLGTVAHHPGESIQSHIERASRKRLFLRDNPRPDESAADFAYRHYPELRGYKPLTIEGTGLNTESRTAVHEAWEMMPQLQQLGVRGTTFHVGNGHVPSLDDMASLANVQPRGWSEGKTWSDCAGAYQTGLDKVIAGGGGGHGSASVFGHETGHAIGKHYGLDDLPLTASFHRTLYDKLPPYLQQGGPGGEAGRQELIAETIAVYVRHGPAAVEKMTDPPYAKWLAGEMKRIGRGRQ